MLEAREKEHRFITPTGGVYRLGIENIPSEGVFVLWCCGSITHTVVIGFLVSFSPVNLDPETSFGLISS